MAKLQDLDWEKMGTALRESALDAHEELPFVELAYEFLLQNPECFGEDEEWPEDMPKAPPLSLVLAYYRMPMKPHKPFTVETLIARLQQLPPKAVVKGELGSLEGAFVDVENHAKSYGEPGYILLTTRKVR